MATRIKRSNVAGATPAALVDGELAINQQDGKLFYRTAAGGVGSITTGTTYTLPAATSSALGGVKQGANVTIATDGTLSVAAPTSSLPATSVTGLATVATSGSYTDLINRPTATVVDQYDSAASFPATGSSGVIYVAGTRMYRWTGGVYVELGTVGGDLTAWTNFLPPAPTALSGTPGVAQSGLTWTAPTVLAQLPVTDYLVQYSSDSGATWTLFQEPSASSATSATVTGLQNGQNYVFRVSAVNAIGQGPWSSPSNSVFVGGDTYFSYVQLLLHFDGSSGSTTFTDSSSAPKTVSAYNGGAISTSAYKFGGASLATGYPPAGPSGAVVSSSSALTLASNDFAIEMWVYPTSIGGTQFLYDQRQGAGYNDSKPCVYMDSSGYLQYMVTLNNRITSSAPLSANTWSHIAIARTSGTTRMYVNGSQTGSSWTDGTNYGSDAIGIGINPGSGYPFFGFVDDLRVTVGSSRGYSGSSIPLPTLAFPNA